MLDENMCLSKKKTRGGCQYFWATLYMCICLAILLFLLFKQYIFIILSYVKQLQLYFYKTPTAYL